MGLIFKGNPPTFNGDIKVEVPTSTYSGKKSSNATDSINPYTSQGPGEGGIGLTNDDIFIERSGKIPFPTSLSNVDTGTQWVSSSLIGNFDISFDVTNFINANIGRLFIYLRDDDLNAVFSNHYMINQRFETASGIDRSYQRRDPDIVKVNYTPSSTITHFRIWRDTNLIYSYFENQETFAADPYLTDVTGYNSLKMIIQFDYNVAGWINKTNNTINISNLTGYY